jgi:arylsulfatase A-like enzyme
MPRPKKRIKKIVEAVQGILGSDIKKKKLRKARNLERFIDQMEARRSELKARLSEDQDLGDQREAFERNVRTLDKQIGRALMLLEELEQEG